MKLVFTISFLFFALIVSAQGFEAQDTSKTNYIDENGLKQGHWIYTNAEKHLPGYRDDQLVEDGFFKDNLRVGIWKKYYENGNLEFELTYMGNRPSGYAVFYYRNGKVSEEGVWKNNRWVGEYKYYHENGKLKYEWKYNASGKREGVQKYYYENGQLMIIGSWNEGKEAGELKTYYSNGALKSEKFFNNGDILPDSTKTYPTPPNLVETEEVVMDDKKDDEKTDNTSKQEEKKDSAVISPKDTTIAIQPLQTNEQHPVGFFDGNGYYKLSDKNGRVSREGDFKKGFLMNGKVYRYNAEGTLEKTIVYKNGKVVEEIDNK